MPWVDRDYDDYRRPSPRRVTSDFRRSVFLSPEYDYPGEMDRYRSRSAGGQPAPTVIKINNDIARSPSRSPEARGRRRASSRLGDDLVDELAERLDHRRRHSYSRSHSRGHSDAALLLGAGAAAAGVGVDPRDVDLAIAQRDLSAARAREARELDARRLKAGWEVQRLREEQQQRRAEEDAWRERQRIIAAHELRVREDAEFEKTEEERIKHKLEREAREKKEKDEREWNEFLRKQKEKEEKEKEEKRKEKEKVDDAMRKILGEKGFSHRSIEHVLAEKKKEGQPVGGTLTPWSRPVIRIHRKHLDINTLIFYQIDFTVSSDLEWLYIHKDLDNYETDVLFNHTRQLRARDKSLLTEPAKGSKRLWQFRRRDSSNRIKERGFFLTKE